MKPSRKKVLKGVGALLLVVAASFGTYVAVQASAFDASMDKVYEVPPPPIVRSTDPEVIARGKHIVEATAGCSSTLCHGADLGGGTPVVMGPVCTLTGPNITGGGLGAAYSDGEIARLVNHGVKKDGRSVRFMPSVDFSWLPASDVTAIVSYMRTVPNVNRPNGPMKVGLIGKVLDRREKFILDVARRINHEKPLVAPPPAPTAEYGAFIGRLCTGCHGEHLSGGAIPGAPSSLPIPLNLTPHATGLAGWTYDDFNRLLTKGMRKNGQAANTFMPFEAVSKFDETEKKALWAYLQTLPPTELGQR